MTGSPAEPRTRVKASLTRDEMEALRELSGRLGLRKTAVATRLVLSQPLPPPAGNGAAWSELAGLASLLTQLQGLLAVWEPSPATAALEHQVRQTQRRVRTARRAVLGLPPNAVDRVGARSEGTVWWGEEVVR